MAIGDLTDREIEILGLISHGWTTTSICEQLNITLSTCKTHIDHILRALGASNRQHAVRLGMERKLI